MGGGGFQLGNRKQNKIIKQNSRTQSTIVFFIRKIVKLLLNFLYVFVRLVWDEGHLRFFKEWLLIEKTNQFRFTNLMRSSG